MVLLDMVRGCVRSCVEELCWLLFFVHIFFSTRELTKREPQKRVARAQK